MGFVEDSSISLLTKSLPKPNKPFQGRVGALVNSFFLLNNTITPRKGPCPISVLVV